MPRNAVASWCIHRRYEAFGTFFDCLLKRLHWILLMQTHDIKHRDKSIMYERSYTYRERCTGWRTQWLRLRWHGKSLDDRRVFWAVAVTDQPRSLQAVRPNCLPTTRSRREISGVTFCAYIMQLSRAERVRTNPTDRSVMCVSSWWPSRTASLRVSDTRIELKRCVQRPSNVLKYWKHTNDENNVSSLIASSDMRQSRLSLWSLDPLRRDVK